MIIENGTQPNCSELVIRLPGWTKDTIRETLYNSGIIDMISYEDGHDKEWDTDSFGPVSYKEIDPKVLKLYDELRKRLDDTNYEKLIKELEDLGYEYNKFSSELLEKGSLSDKEYGSSMWISTCSEDGPNITYHQHCQTQGFPLLRRVSELFNADVEPEDGGDTTDYNEWLDNQFSGEGEINDREENYN